LNDCCLGGLDWSVDEDQRDGHRGGIYIPSESIELKDEDKDRTEVFMLSRIVGFARTLIIGDNQNTM
jgi:hypothetical protein